jgi:hypothetical protein
LRDVVKQIKNRSHTKGGKERKAKELMKRRQEGNGKENREKGVKNGRKKENIDVEDVRSF